MLVAVAITSLQRAVEQLIDAVQAGTGGELNAEI
jgi:hypothetical protein